MNASKLAHPGAAEGVPGCGDRSPGLPTKNRDRVQAPVVADGVLGKPTNVTPSSYHIVLPRGQVGLT